MGTAAIRALALGAIVISVVLAAPGCEAVRTHIGPITLDTSEGISFGGSFASSLGAGGLTHELVSATGGKDPEKWAAAVAVGSFVANEIVQNEVERRRAEHERESEYLDSEIEIAENSIEERETELSRIEKELAQQERAVAALEASRRDDDAFRRRAAATREDLRKLIARLEEEREIAEAEIEIYTEAVRSSEGQTDDSVSEEELEARRKELIAKRDERLRQYELVIARGKAARDLERRVEELDS